MSVKWRPAVVVPSAIAMSLLVAALAWWDTHRPDHIYRRALEDVAEARRAAAVDDLPRAAQRRAAALQAYRRLKEIPGYEDRGHYLAGALLAASSDYSRALGELYQVPESSEVVLAAKTLGAECLYRSGQIYRAAETARAVVERDPRALDARRWLAAALYDLGAIPSAAIELEIIARDAPTDGQPLRLLGVIERDQGRFAQAVEYYSEALRREPSARHRGEILEELADCQIRLGQFDAALGTLGDCPETAQSLTLAARCHLALGQFDQAASCVEKALEQKPDSAAALELKGELLENAGRFAEAANVFARAIELMPADRDLRLRLAGVYDRLEEPEHAAAERAAAEEAGKLAEEFRLLHAEADKKVSDPGVRCRLGTLALKMNRPDLARMWYRCALGVAPENAEARQALEQLLTKDAARMTKERRNPNGE